MSFVSSLCWVKRGAAKTPSKIDIDKKELEKILKSEEKKNKKAEKKLKKAQKEAQNVDVENGEKNDQSESEGKN